MQGYITVWVDRELGTINRNIYGSFAEHLGRCIYGGLWVGPQSRIPNDEGLRRDVVQALAAMKLPVLRWPGGCFADDYHWEGGIGPQRRPRRNLWWNQPETNEFGTDEFIHLCRAVGCEPYISVNVGSGTVEEAINWMEYCNSSQESHYANLRRRHASPEPYGVRYWGVGNENWGCGGNMSPQQYAYECRKYACFMRKMGVDLEAGAYLIACGDEREPWNAEVLRHLGGAVGSLDALSIHMYRGGAPAQAHAASETFDASPEHFYRLMGEVVGMEEKVRQTAALLDYYSPSDHKLGLVVDEWGTWYCDTDEGLFQQSPLKDGLFAAAALNMFNRHCDSVVMTNMAQTANVLQAVILTRGSEMVLTPTYHAYEMMKGHQGATLLASQANSTTLADTEGRAFETLSLSASRSAKGCKLRLSVVNMSLEEDCRTEITLRGLETVKGVSARVLTSEQVTDCNDFDDGDRIKPQPVEVQAAVPSFSHTFPAKSLTVIEIEL